MNGALASTSALTKAAVADALQHYFDERIDASATYNADLGQLWTLAAQGVVGGKLVRPTLLIETYEALSDGPAPASVIEIASAVELLHYSFLLHDDVIDGDLIRRGSHNLIGALIESAQQNGQHESRPNATLHWAQSGAILMGDLLLARTHQVFAKAPVGRAIRDRLLDLLDATITESVAGEFLDVGLGDGMVQPELDVILRMCGHKTAAYTFELPLLAAAALAGAEAHLEHALSSAGRHLGLAFQLQDDLLSMFGDHVAHGKDPFSDLREGKQTALMAYARSTSTWPDIEPFFGSKTVSIDDGYRVRALLTDCGADSFVQNLIDEQADAFRVAVAGLAGNAPRVEQVLTALAARLDGRKS